MYFDAIRKTKRGLVTCVFDVTDRIQHMFYRHLVEGHPANLGRDNETHKNAIRDLYVRMDDLVGRSLEHVDDGTVFMIMSDHGFKPFERGVNLNSWLWKNGHMVLKGERTGADMFQDVDWDKTRAYAVGFGGIYLNVKGREARGIVAAGDEAQRLKAEIIAKLSALRDEERGSDAVRKVYDAHDVYSGPYVGDAPDLIVGFKLGYRVSWSSVTGGLTEAVIEDNTRPWSGDHNFNPPDVPGMLFCNRPIAEEKPRIIDIGPTVLDLFGVDIPPYCDGRSIMPAGEAPVRGEDTAL
jgi:predicted AlkP superfamily phosphohydrolase/phosphomutase